LGLTNGRVNFEFLSYNHEGISTLLFPLLDSYIGPISDENIMEAISLMGKDYTWEFLDSDQNNNFIKGILNKTYPFDHLNFTRNLKSYCKDVISRFPNDSTHLQILIDGKVTHKYT